MGVCAVVKELAAALAVTLPPREPTHVALIQLLQQMPAYFERRQASEWEGDFAEARGMDDDESTLGVLIDAIFNFAIYDFYGAFDEPGSAHKGACHFWEEGDEAGLLEPPPSTTLGTQGCLGLN